MALPYPAFARPDDPAPRNHPQQAHWANAHLVRPGIQCRCRTDARRAAGDDAGHLRQCHAALRAAAGSTTWKPCSGTATSWSMGARRLKVRSCACNRRAGARRMEPSMLGLDPPEHDRLRGLVNKAFTPKAVDRMAPRIQEIADELLDAVQDREEWDLIGDFSAPLPTIVRSPRCSACTRTCRRSSRSGLMRWCRASTRSWARLSALRSRPR